MIDVHGNCLSPRASRVTAGYDVSCGADGGSEAPTTIAPKAQVDKQTTCEMTHTGENEIVRKASTIPKLLKIVLIFLTETTEKVGRFGE